MPKVCGFGKHPLKDGVLVTDPIYYSFIHKSRPDYRPEDEVCLICRNSMEHMYRKKKRHARLLRASRNGAVSTLSSMDSFDSLVYKTPQHQKSRKDEDSSQSVNIDQSELSKFFDTTSTSSQSVNGSHEKAKSRNKQNLANVFANDSHEKVASGSNTSNGDILQENRSVISISTVVSAQSSLDTVIRQKVTSNREVIIQDAASSTVLLNLSNDNVMSPTIYDDPDDVRYFRDSLNVRLSQEPTTSAAAVKSLLQQKSPEVTTATPKSRGIRRYFKTLQVNGTSNNNTQVSALRQINNNTSPDAPTPTLDRMNQASISNRKRPLNDNADSSDHTNADSDDDEPRMSLNYYNPNVRFPQYQPIPKRRQFQHKNDIVMDMYIQGLNGG